MRHLYRFCGPEIAFGDQEKFRYRDYYLHKGEHIHTTWSYYPDIVYKVQHRDQPHEAEIGVIKFAPLIPTP